MQTQDACVGWIVSLVEAADPSAARRALAEVDAFLSSFGGPSGAAARRADLLAQLHRSLPKNALAAEVIEAISREIAGS